MEYRAVAKDSAGHLSASSSLRDRRRPQGQRWRRRWRGSGDPARRRQRPRRPQLRDGLLRPTGRPTAPRPSSRSTPRTRSGRAPTRSPRRPTPTRSRSTRAGTRTTERAACPVATTSATRLRQAGDVLLRPRHALRHLGRPGPDHHRARAPSSPSWAVRPTGARTACGPWLQDPDGDGTYTWSSDQLPAGTYEFKVAHGLSWDENYGAGRCARRRQHLGHRPGRRHGRVDLLRARRPTSPPPRRSRPAPPPT